MTKFNSELEAGTLSESRGVLRRLQQMMSARKAIATKSRVVNSAGVKVLCVLRSSHFFFPEIHN